MTPVRLAAVVALLATGPVAAAAPLAAQDKDALCRNIQNRPLRVGRWASYAWRGGRSDGGTLRLAVIGSEAHEGTTYYWYEMVMHDPARGAGADMVVQVLVPGLGFQAGNVRALIMKTGDQPATRVPDAMVRMMGPRVGTGLASEIARNCQGMEVVGWERVTVPAGTFRALHLRNPSQGTEAWLRPELDFALVKMAMADGGTLALTASGADATSSIADPPR